MSIISSHNLLMVVLLWGSYRYVEAFLVAVERSSKRADVKRVSFRGWRCERAPFTAKLVSCWESPGALTNPSLVCGCSKTEERLVFIRGRGLPFLNGSWFVIAMLIFRVKIQNTHLGYIELRKTVACLKKERKTKHNKGRGV